MQPDPSLDTTHAMVHPGGSAAPEPHSTHQVAPPHGSQTVPQAVPQAVPQGEQAGPLADGPQQEEQAGQRAEEQAGEQQASGFEAGPKADPPQAGSKQQAEEQQGGQRVAVAAHSTSAQDHLLALAAPPGCGETYQPTANGLDQQHHAALATSQPGHQASTHQAATHQAAVNQAAVSQAYAAAELPEELPEAPGTPGMYDGEAHGAHPCSGEAYGGACQHGGAAPGGQARDDLPYHGVTPGGQVVYHGELQGTYPGEAHGAHHVVGPPGMQRGGPPGMRHGCLG